MEKYAQNLEEFGFELFPYADGVQFDAVIYDGDKQNGMLKKLNAADRELFVLNVHALTPVSAATKLKARLYSSLF
jgi:hypothetical protein